ncbi:hypothetical protein N7U66_03265 [Lacinutrix neustonica]|uniref:Uncharacterized protein n=1 Tax=Lacinutrix neustonica TaxID=2980107 RepID=A0A9E8SHH8_9FLAO|nr:hypothetical protein [Lacinutrix neustonica]WAC02705.1 hypothetical protein N7U66_03265 [Lacinutrix neustonica]
MFDKLKNINFFQEKKFAIIGIVMGEVPFYEILVLDNKLDNLSIIDSFSTKHFDKIKEKVDLSIPILLNFSGKGVVSKKVLYKVNYLKEILFNASPEDFYIYELHQDKYEFVSIARKEVLDNLFGLFRKDNYLVLDYSIGPFVGVMLKKILNKELFFSGDSQLNFEEDLLVDFNNDIKNIDNYAIGQDKISSSQVPLFTTLLNHLYPFERISYDFEFLKPNKQELKLKKIFNSSVAFLGIFFLGALLSSYLLLNYYNNQYITYESQLYNLNHTYNQVRKLEAERQDKVIILQECRVLKENFIAFYVNDIVNNIPNNISLMSLVVNPKINKNKRTEKIILEPNTILIQGDSDSSLPLNTWVKDLKTKTWISKIEIRTIAIKEKTSVSLL